MDVGSRVGIEVRAGGLDDPDAIRAAAVVAAYFEAEQALASRRRVWRAVAVAGLVMWALSTMTSTLTPVDLAFSIPLLGMAVVVSGATEWRARKRLGALVDPTDVLRR